MFAFPGWFLLYFMKLAETPDAPETTVVEWIVLPTSVVKTECVSAPSNHPAASVFEEEWPWEPSCPEGAPTYISEVQVIG